MNDNEKPQGSPYEGPSGIARDSNWLTAEDLVEGKDMTLKVDKALLYPKVKWEKGRESENVLGLTFSGKKRVLGLNATNRKAMNKMFGNITAAWRGKEIVLYVAETRKPGTSDEMVKCVRIRVKGTRPATAAEQFLAGEEHNGEATSPPTESLFGEGPAEPEEETA